VTASGSNGSIDAMVETYVLIESSGQGSTDDIASQTHVHCVKHWPVG